MKNIYVLVLIIAICLMAKTGSIAQDLIQRTQQGITFTRSSVPNEIANQLAAAKSVGVARNANFDPFEIAPAINSITENFTSEGVFLTLKEEVIATLLENKLPTLTLNVPVDAKSTFALDLYKVDVYAEDFRLRTQDGTIATAAPNRGLFYRGTVANDKNSIVAVSIFENFMRIMIGDNEGNYIIGKMPNNGQHILYNDRNLLLPPPPACGNTDIFEINKKEFRPTTTQSNARFMMDKCVPIYVECDYQMYVDHGGHVSSVQNFVGSLINETATIYTNEGISISLSDVKVWTTVDPYANLNSTGDVLREFGRLTQNNYNGRLAHWISTRRLGGGVAWVDVLCSEYFTFGNPVQHAGPYAVSANMGTSVTAFPTYSNEVNIFAHEMGHNFGSPHTQSCSWNGNDTAIDGCYPTEGGCPRPTPNCPPGGGTIMSYCHILSGCGVDFNNGFGDQPGALIKSRFDNASCMLSCAAPTCDDGLMNGDETGIDCGGNTCPSCPCFDSPLSLSITLDNYPQEVTWDIRNSANAVLHSGGPYSQNARGTTITANNLTLSNGTGYVFTMYDSFGDGICCGQGNGSFTLRGGNGDLIADGGQYSSEIEFTFCVNNGDECPDDPNKSEPGECGCGTPETDSDNDGTPDCNDQCPNDPNKIMPMICGCDTPETDSDNDGTPDCSDACPDDPNKTRPLECGCGVADVDSDNDKVLDCDDMCPNDPNKTMPGSCGCGVSDFDNNGQPNCADGDCVPNRSVDDSPASGTYQASGTLMTDGVVKISGTAVFQAGDDIILRTGFHALAGSNFTAEIAGCTPAFAEHTTINSTARTAPTFDDLRHQSLDLKVFPNPFNQQTTIRYQLSEETEVFIRIANVNGQIIQHLANGVLGNKGLNEVQLDGSRLSEGVYYVLLQTATEVSSQKVILVR